MSEAPRPRRLIVDKKDLYADVRRDFSRAVTAMALSKLSPSKQYPADILKERWPNDDASKRVLKAISPPLDSSLFYAAMPSEILPAIMPNAAASRLFERGKTLSLSGINAVRLPYIGASGRPPNVPWIGEGAPIAVADMTTSSVTLGPIKKLAVITTLSEELGLASGGTASAIMATALDIATSQQVDAWLFSANAASATAPAGILFGVSPTPPSSSAGANSVDKLATDIAALAQAISAAGIATDDLVFFTDAGSAEKIAILSSPKFVEKVFPSTQIAAGTIVAVQPRGFYVGFGQQPVQVETSREATFHYDTTPGQIVDSSGTVGAPTRSLFQQGLLAIKVRAQATWIVHPGACAYLTGANW